METLILYIALVIQLFIFMFIRFSIYKRIVAFSIGHVSSHIKEIELDFLGLQTSLINSGKMGSETLVNLDNNRTKNIVLFNNVKQVVLDKEDELLIDLFNPINKVNRFDLRTKDYEVKQEGEQPALLSNVLMSHLFPKKYGELKSNVTELFNFKDIGYDINYTIKMDKIIALSFNSKHKKLYIFVNDWLISSIVIPYKTKTQMLQLIKSTRLGDYLYQMGVPGYSDSDLSFVSYQSKESKGELDDE